MKNFVKEVAEIGTALAVGMIIGETVNKGAAKAKAKADEKFVETLDREKSDKTFKKEMLKMTAKAVVVAATSTVVGGIVIGLLRK